MGGIELAGVAPDLQIGLLHNVGGEVVAAQNAQHHAVELGAGRAIEPLERDRVTLGDGREQPCDFNRRRHDGKSYFLLASPFKLAPAAQPWCIAVPAAAAVEPASGERAQANLRSISQARSRRGLWPPKPPSVETGIAGTLYRKRLPRRTVPLRLDLARSSRG